MPDTRVSAIGTLGEALSIVWRGRQLVLLLIAFLSLVSLIFLWPILDWYVALLTDFSVGSGLDPAATQEMMDNMGYFFIGYVPFLFFMLAPLVLWSRASIGGAGIAMEGGFMALLKRTLWVVWRYICMIGWALLFALAMMIIFFVIGLIVGIGGAAFEAGDPSLSAFALLFIIPLYIIFLIAIIALTFLYSVSLHGEARDFRLPIHKSFIALKGNLLRATGVLFAAILVFYVVYILFTAVIIGAILAASTWLTIIGLFFLFALGNIYNFIWISYGALYASKLVPELKG